MSLLICTPAYGGMVHSAHMRSCLELHGELTRAGLDHDWLLATNESLITRARNEMTATFLKTDWRYMMWIDADIEFTAEDVSRLWNLQTDIACGLYPMKRLDFPLSAWRGGKLVDLAECPAEPFEVDYAGTGFMLIRRNVLETLAQSVPAYEGPFGQVSAFYQTPVHNEMFESEDYHFCRIAREAGFKIIADPSIKLRHWGQYGYAAP